MNAATEFLIEGYRDRIEQLNQQLSYYQQQLKACNEYLDLVDDYLWERYGFSTQDIIAEYEHEIYS